MDDAAETAGIPVTGSPVNGIPVTGIPVGASAGGDDAEAKEQQLPLPLAQEEQQLPLPLAQEEAKDTENGKEQVQQRMLLCIIYYCCST